MSTEEKTLEPPKIFKLNRQQKVLWKMFVEAMSKQGLEAKDMDIFIIKELVRVYEQLDEAEEYLNIHGHIDQTGRRSSISITASDLHKRLVVLYKECGLTPNSRGDLSVNKKERETRAKRKGSMKSPVSGVPTAQTKPKANTAHTLPSFRL